MSYSFAVGIGLYTDTDGLICFGQQRSIRAGRANALKSTLIAAGREGSGKQILKLCSDMLIRHEMLSVIYQDKRSIGFLHIRAFFLVIYKFLFTKV